MVLRNIILKGIQVSCYGKGWENGFVDADENIRPQNQH